MSAEWIDRAHRLTHEADAQRKARSLARRFPHVEYLVKQVTAEDSPIGIGKWGIFVRPREVTS